LIRDTSHVRPPQANEWGHCPPSVELGSTYPDSPPLTPAVTTYAVLQWVAEQGSEEDLDGSRIAVAGDSVGGNMTAAQTLLAKERSGPHIGAQVLCYPVTDASLDTDSYHQFAEGYFLRRDGMCDHRRR
jgi:acetyl esterase